MKRPWSHWLGLGLLAMVIVLAPLAFHRNPGFKFCTTQAYGYPLPWYVDWCSCERSRSPFQIHYWLGNFVLFVGDDMLVGITFPHFARWRHRRRRT